MGSVAWLSQLAPPHAPSSASMWPPAPGWWALLVILLAMVFAFIYRQHKTRLSRIALKELKKLQADDDIAFAGQLEHLLRRYAIARFGRDDVAALSGERWIAFVVEHGGTALQGEIGADFLRLAYGGTAAENRVAWLSGAEGFIRGRS